MKTNNKRFLVYNLTDGIEAHPDLMMLAEARWTNNSRWLKAA